MDGSSQAAKRLATSNDNHLDLNSLGPIDVKVSLGYFTTLGTFVILASGRRLPHPQSGQRSDEERGGEATALES